MIDMLELMKKEVQPYVIGVPDFILKPMVAEAMYDFCDESGAWTEDQIIGAYDNDIQLYPKDPINSVIIGVEWVKRKDSNSCYHHTFKMGKVILEFIPEADIEIRVKLANNKNTNTLLVPDWFYNQHHRAIRSLTCYKLMTQDGKPWANAQGAGFHYNKYREYLGGGVIKATPDRVHLRPFV
ncbi:hypothetical protein [Vibrio jasicida]|uniref:hypothetical protein n=1 Tax=Vibrio jasicida TaxID=766224 RepID=UPI0005ED7333|nr:hypothetical protein [Vibrio jasicida]